MPRINDKQGHELTVGARVETAGGGDGTFTGTAVEQFGFVALADFPNAPGQPFYVQPPSYRCPELLLIDSPTEGKEG